MQVLIFSVRRCRDAYRKIRMSGLGLWGRWMLLWLLKHLQQRKWKSMTKPLNFFTVEFGSIKFPLFIQVDLDLWDKCWHFSLMYHVSLINTSVYLFQSSKKRSIQVWFICNSLSGSNFHLGLCSNSERRRCTGKLWMVYLLLQ